MSVWTLWTPALAGAQDTHKHMSTLALGLLLHLVQPHQVQARGSSGHRGIADPRLSPWLKHVLGLLNPYTRSILSDPCPGPGLNVWGTEHLESTHLNGLLTRLSSCPSQPHPWPSSGSPSYPLERSKPAPCLLAVMTSGCSRW